METIYRDQLANTANNPMGFTKSFEAGTVITLSVWTKIRNADVIAINDSFRTPVRKIRQFTACCSFVEFVFPTAL